MFKANPGGHAPGHLRQAFCDWVNEWKGGSPDMTAHQLAALEAGHPQMPDTVELDGRRMSFRWLVGQLWNCRDQVPSDLRMDLVGLAGDELSTAYTYGQAVRRLRAMRTGGC